MGWPDEPDVDVRWMEGTAPVQAGGLCCGGRPFYFRARGTQISIAIRRTPKALEGHALTDWIMHEDEAEVWEYMQEAGEWPAAGAVPDAMAHAFITWGCWKFLFDMETPDGTGEDAGEEP